MIFTNETPAFFLSVLLLCGGANAQLMPETSLAFSQSSQSAKTDLFGGAELNDRIGQALAAGDFNGDGYLDLLIGAPFKDQGDHLDSGWVHVVYGKRGGLSADDDEIWSQAGAIEGALESGDRSGFSVTVGDFNGDGIDDLAFGSPGEAIGSLLFAGAINVIYGSPSGLTEVDNRQFHQDTPGIGGGSEQGDQMGHSLAAGDLNDDGFDDLVIGVPFEDIGTVEAAGAIQVLFGSASGLTEVGNVFLSRNADGMGGVAIGDSFGRALAVGNFNGDQYPDLAIGAPNDSRFVVDAGTVHLIYGGVNGLDLSSNEVWGLDSLETDLAPAVRDNFGYSLTVGDFDADGFEDLVIGVPGYQNSAGAALLLHGGNSGLASARHRLLQPGVDEFPGSTQPESLFADSLTAGDINGDGADDLMAGSRDRDVGSESFAGAVLIAYGEPGVGLVNQGSVLWDRSDLEVVGNPVSFDAFGSAVLLADFDGDGLDDAVISSPGRDVNLVADAGDVIVVSTLLPLFSDGFELTTGGTFRDCDDCPLMVNIPGGSFTQGSPPGEPESNDDERPQHTVNVPAFALGQTEVTFDEWDACVADGGCTHNPDDDGWGRGNRPVINVTWNDAQEYVAWLSAETGEDYRLPSESEWEYATRAGTTGRFNTGDCITTDQANFDGEFPAQGCPSGINRAQTLPVASFGPNAFGLYDTHGNVWEWVQDCWNGSYNGAPTDGSAWMMGNCSRAVLRGGSWNFPGLGLRSAYRNWNIRGYRNDYIGFRPARSVTL